jgi:hypothetical protein
MLSNYINIPLFIASFAIGIFAVYISDNSEMRKIHVYPTPENIDLILYKDDAGSCFKFKQTKVTCPKNEKDITKIPVQ